MKKILFSFSFFILVFTAYSQNADKPLDENQRQAVLSKTLCVVLDDKQEVTYFKNIKQSVEKYWKITPYKFITESEFNKLSAEEETKYAFLYLNSYISIYSGGTIVYKDRVGRVQDNSMAASTTRIVPIIFYYPDTKSVEVPVQALSGFEYKVIERGVFGKVKSEVSWCNNPEIAKIMIRNFQTYLKPNYSHEDKNNGQLCDIIKKKTLIIPKNALYKNRDTEEYIKDYYSYKFKIVSDEEWKKYVDADADDIVYLYMEQTEGHGGKGKYIIEANTGEILYIEARFPYFLKQNLKEISESK